LPPQLPAPHAPKRATTELPPPAPRQPQDAIRTDKASPEPLEAHDVTEKKGTWLTRFDPSYHTLASQGHLARPANWASMSRKARKKWMAKQAKHLVYLNK